MQTFSKENILTVLSSLSFRAHQHHEKAGTQRKFCDKPRFGTEFIFVALAVAKFLSYSYMCVYNMLHNKNYWVARLRIVLHIEINYILHSNWFSKLCSISNTCLTQLHLLSMHQCHGFCCCLWTSSFALKC